MITVHDTAEAREHLNRARRSGGLLGFVPTMGALHLGHRSLIQRARRDCDIVAVSIFVNPKQFENAADLAGYPETLDADMAMCREEGVDVVYVPSGATMYGKNHEVLVSVPGLGATLEGAGRPGHFDGVALVVTKLLATINPDVTYLGQKDYQQTLVIRRLVEDLDLGTKVVVSPTIREADGLALSSRNVRLRPEARSRATHIPSALFEANRRFLAGEKDPEILMSSVRAQLDLPEFEVHYITIVSSGTLYPSVECRADDVLLVAVTVGGVRLIDNVILGR